MKVIVTRLRCVIRRVPIVINQIVLCEHLNILSNISQQQIVTKGNFITNGNIDFKSERFLKEVKIEI
ncbi:hypothetical protein ACH3XW_35005 [Acanthocheilonema viteae]